MIRLSEYITSEELKSLCQLSDWLGWYRVLYNYALIYMGFLLFSWFPNPLTFILSSCILAGRILGLGILNHDASHGTLFKTPSLNRWMGKWMLGSLVLVDFDAFKKGHAEHHRLAGSGKDPDLLFVQNYPATRASMKRKFLRDFIGVNGFKEVFYQIKVSTLEKRIPNLLAHLTLLFSLMAIGFGWSYVVFWFAFLFIYPAFTRLRIMGEHGAVQNNNDVDPRFNTRTTSANWLERLFVAPNEVNFHLEHHIHPKIPAHKLKTAHKLFKQRDMYEGFNCVAGSYWQVIKECTSNTTGQSNNGTHAPSAVSNQS